MPVSMWGALDSGRNEMKADPDFSAAASLLAEPARAAVGWTGANGACTWPPLPGVRRPFPCWKRDGCNATPTVVPSG